MVSVMVMSSISTCAMCLWMSTQALMFFTRPAGEGIVRGVEVDGPFAEHPYVLDVPGCRR